MLKIIEFSAEVGGYKILDNLSLEIPAGEVHAIMGPNGSDKSRVPWLFRVCGGRHQQLRWQQAGG